MTGLIGIIYFTFRFTLMCLGVCGLAKLTTKVIR
jgi:hypothetical protein